MVAVVEQSPNTSEMRAHPPASSPSTLLMEPCYDDTQEEVQPSQDMPVIVETHTEPSEDVQVSDVSVMASGDMRWEGSCSQPKSQLRFLLQMMVSIQQMV